MSTQPGVAERLITLDTPTLSDALDAIGLPCGVGGIVPFGPQRRVAGQAHTVKLITDDGQPRSRHLCTSAIEASAPGSVIVVEHHDRDDAAGWGGLLTAAAIEAGVAGVIVDGACRDVDDYVQLDFPVYARNAVPATARTRVVETESDTPIAVGGRIVTPGDWVVADRSGLVVIPLSAAADVLAAAERIKHREDLMVADLRSGARVTEVLGRNYETMLTTDDPQGGSR